MAAEKNKAIVRRFFEEGFNTGNFASAGQFIAPHFANHDPATPDLPSGLKGFEQLVTTYRTAFPDIHITIEDLVTEGNRVAARWTAHGRQTGPLMNLPPTGKLATVTGISIFSLMDNRIVETWVNWDTLGLLQQLGAVPAPAQTIWKAG